MYGEPQIGKASGLQLIGGSTLMARYCQWYADMNAPVSTTFRTGLGINHTMQGILQTFSFVTCISHLLQQVISVRLEVVLDMLRFIWTVLC